MFLAHSNTTMLIVHAGARCHSGFELAVSFHYDEPTIRVRKPKPFSIVINHTRRHTFFTDKAYGVPVRK